LEKEARNLDFLTQLGSEDFATSKVSSEESLLSRSPLGSPDSDKILVMEDVSTNGEELVSPTQAPSTMKSKELLYSDFDPKAKEPKVAVVITPRLDGKTVLKPIATKKKRRRVESSQSTMNQFSQYICYGEEDSDVEDL
jgi:hypothetical protein